MLTCYGHPLVRELCRPSRTIHNNKSGIVKFHRGDKIYTISLFTGAFSRMRFSIDSGYKGDYSVSPYHHLGHTISSDINETIYMTLLVCCF